MIYKIKIKIMEKQRGRTRTEVFSRIVGYLRPVSQWNSAKQEEFKDRKLFSIKKAMKK